MRNIDKKWALFGASTIICLYGILYTLLNVTFAVKAMPIDNNFNDINFYKCVIDSYNSTYSLKLDYDDMMDYNKLKDIKVISCDNKDVMERDKIISLKGMELITSLEDISLTYTSLSNIDLSNNKNIKKINLEGNSLISNLYVYKGEKIFLNDGLDISNEFVNNDIVWSNQNKDIVDVNFYNMVYAKDNGVAVILGRSNLGYDVINNIHVISISSLKYEIVKDTIYIDNINDFNIQDIECNDENVTIIIWNYMLNIMMIY